MRRTVTADLIVLHDDWSPYDHFTLVPYFPFWRRGRPFGMVRNLISPQEQLNKISSQELHIVNTTANSGWIVESGSLSGMDADDLEEHGAETGLVLEFNSGFNPPAKIPPNQIPTGLDRISQKAAVNIKQISGISDSMLGTDSPEVSGVAIQAKQNRGAMMSAFNQRVYDPLLKAFGEKFIPQQDGSKSMLTPPLQQERLPTRFKTDVVNVTKWVAKRLGHPVMQLEFNSSSIWACFEEATSDYSQYINTYNMKNWLWDH